MATRSNSPSPVDFAGAAKSVRASSIGAVGSGMDLAEPAATMLGWNGNYETNPSNPF
jgi:hypothetical protein